MLSRLNRSNPAALPRGRRGALKGPSAAGAPWGWAATGAVIGLGVALVAFAPAHWLASAVTSATQGRVVLSDARGTVWTGSARMALTGGDASNAAAALPGRVDWKLRPRLTGLAARFNAECCTPKPLQAAIALGLGRLNLSLVDGQSSWPAALLSGLGTPWNTLQLDGQLSLATQGLSVEWAQGRLAVSGLAQMEAREVSSRLSTLRPMGSYKITVNGGATSTLQLETLEGSLQLSGSGQWVDSRLRFKGEASAAPEREAALSNLLNIIGRRSGARSIITIG